MTIPLLTAAVINMPQKVLKQEKKMAKRVMDDALKAKLAQGRADARTMRTLAPKLMEEYGTYLKSWKFWKALPAEDRDAIAAAIRKADVSLLNEDIKRMQTQLEAKMAEKESLTKR
jgi:hypothetical protein